jgi:hypothetical protein
MFVGELPLSDEHTKGHLDISEVACGLRWEVPHLFYNVVQFVNSLQKKTEYLWCIINSEADREN